MAGSEVAVAGSEGLLRSLDYPCTRRLRLRRLLACIRGHGDVDVYLTARKKTKVIFNLKYLVKMVREGQWKDAFFYISSFPKWNYEARLLDVFMFDLVAFKAFADGYVRIMSYLSDWFMLIYKNPVLFKKYPCFATVVADVLFMRKDHASAFLDWQLVSKKAAKMVEEIANKTPELRDRMQYPRSSNSLYHFMPIGSKRRSMKHASRKQPADLVQFYLQMKKRLTSLSPEQVYSDLPIQRGERLIALFDTCFEAGRLLGLEHGQFPEVLSEGFPYMQNNLARGFRVISKQAKLPSKPDTSQRPAVVGSSVTNSGTKRPRCFQESSLDTVHPRNVPKRPCTAGKIGDLFKNGVVIQEGEDAGVRHPLLVIHARRERLLWIIRDGNLQEAVAYYNDKVAPLGAAHGSHIPYTGYMITEALRLRELVQAAIGGSPWPQNLDMIFNRLMDYIRLYFPETIVYSMLTDGRKSPMWNLSMVILGNNGLPVQTISGKIHYRCLACGDWQEGTNKGIKQLQYHLDGSKKGSVDLCPLTTPRIFELMGMEPSPFYGPAPPIEPFFLQSEDDPIDDAANDVPIDPMSSDDDPVDDAANKALLLDGAQPESAAGVPVGNMDLVLAAAQPQPETVAAEGLPVGNIDLVLAAPQPQAETVAAEDVLSSRCKMNALLDKMLLGLKTTGGLKWFKDCRAHLLELSGVCNNEMANEVSAMEVLNVISKVRESVEMNLKLFKIVELPCRQLMQEMLSEVSYLEGLCLDVL